MAKRHKQTCPVAGFANIFGDSWTWLILREAFYGGTRFTDFQKNTGISKNLLSERLSMLISEGVLEQVNVGDRGPRFIYQLTKKGEALVPVFAAAVQWSNEHVYGAGNEPLHLVERETLKKLEPVHPKTADGHVLGLKDISALPGPGADDAARLRVEESGQ